MGESAGSNPVVASQLWYVCKYCQRAFQHASGLVEHKNKVHQNEIKALKKAEKKKKRRKEKSRSESEEGKDRESSVDVKVRMSRYKKNNSMLDEDEDELKSQQDSTKSSAGSSITNDVNSGSINASPRAAGSKDARRALIVLEKFPDLGISSATLAASTATSNLPRENIQTAKLKRKSSLPVLEKLADNPVPELKGKSDFPATEKILTKVSETPEKEPVMPVLSQIVHTQITASKVRKQFRCSFCEKIFKNAGAFTLHSRVHEGPTPYKCQVCSIKFHRKDDWKAHELIHNDSENCCKFCPQVFKSSEDCSLHEATHSLVSKAKKKTGTRTQPSKRKRRKSLYSFPKKNKCSICTKAFSTREGLEAHRDRVHKVKSHKECRFCQKVFATPNSCRIHEYSHTQETPYECLYCDQGFANSGRRINHMKKEHPREFAASSRFHRDSDESNEDDDCNQDSQQEPPMQAATTINELGPLKLKLGLVKGKGKSGKVTRAHILPNTNNEKDFLKTGHETKESNFNTTASESQTGKSRVYKYECTFCGLKCRNPDSLTKHEMIHTGLKPHQCGVCGRRFARPDNLRVHSTIHTGDSPYKCGVCFKTFTARNTLLQHSFIHTGEKPYKCSLCDACFQYKNTLKSHMIRHQRNAQTAPVTAKKVRTVSVVRPTARKPEAAEMENTEEIPSKETDTSEIIRQEVDSGLIHYFCTLCKRVFWYRAEADSHARVAHPEALPEH